VLRFTIEEEYYAYISYFYPEGEYARSGGQFLRGGYMHIAYLHLDSPGVDRTILVHELTHNLLAGFPLPLWVGEALAMTFEQDLAGARQPVLDRALAEQHRTYWTAQTIQEFWRGDSFQKSEAQSLAYGLSRILLNLIATELRPAPPQFRDFVTHANQRDAGQAAAQQYLGIDLSDLVSTFLGPGDWWPKI
jgi:hypothetical protein